MIVSAAQRVAEHRAQRGWSQAELAVRSQVSRTEISAIECGRVVPSVSVALRLAESLGASVEAIFGRQPVIATAWAWQPAVPEQTRAWRATMQGRRLVYPVEPTAAGLIPHDSIGLVEERLNADDHPDNTLVVAGCDPTVGLLARELRARHGIRLLPLLRSSGQALELLKRGVVHAAGLHLSYGDDATGNERHVRTTLGNGYVLVHQVGWEAGIALSNERRERSVRAVLRSDARWVNHEAGSAARRTFDRLLDGRREPRGYTRVVPDHRSVAMSIACGWADAGICIRVAAEEASLGFIPVQREVYDLCLPESLLDDPRIGALLQTLRSPSFRHLLGQIPGCASEQTGKQRLVP